MISFQFSASWRMPSHGPIRVLRSELFQKPFNCRTDACPNARGIWVPHVVRHAQERISEGRRRGLQEVRVHDHCATERPAPRILLRLLRPAGERREDPVLEHRPFEAGREMSPPGQKTVSFRYLSFDSPLPMRRCISLRTISSPALSSEGKACPPGDRYSLCNHGLVSFAKAYRRGR